MGILKETEKVQDEGGLYIDYGQQKRRRTSGGVFIKLLRDNISKEKWDEINKANREDPLSKKENNNNNIQNHNQTTNRESLKLYRPKERILQPRKPNSSTADETETEQIEEEEETITTEGSIDAVPMDIVQSRDPSLPSVSVLDEVLGHDKGDESD